MNCATRGFKFIPTKQEAFFYLKNKAMGHPLPWDGIQEKDVYGEEPPWELFKEDAPWVTIDEDDDDEPESKKINKRFLYCFTRMKKLSKKRKSTRRKLRISEYGRWVSSTGKQLSNDGIMKFFSFKKSSGLSFDEDAANDKWTMIEYSLSGKILKKIHPQFRDYVICKVTQHVRKRVSRKQDNSSVSCLNLLEYSSEETVFDLDLNREESRIGIDGAETAESRTVMNGAETAESRNVMNGAESEVESALNEESTL